MKPVLSSYTTIGLVLLLLLIPVLYLFPIPATNQSVSKNQPRRDLFPDRFFTPRISAEEANKELETSHHVIGVNIRGNHIAYPIRWLTVFEVINDVVGGIPIVVGYWMICQTAVVYRRTITYNNEKKSTFFHNDGRLYKGAFIMYDTLTNSNWNHATGTALKGRLKGKQLEPLSSRVMTWGTWYKQHPDGIVMAPPTQREIDKSTVDKTSFLTQYGPGEVILPVSEKELGLAIGFGPKQIFLRIKKLKKERIVQGLTGRKKPYIAISTSNEKRQIEYFVYNRKIDNRTLKFKLRNSQSNSPPFFLIDLQTKSRWDPHTGKAVSGPMKGAKLESMIAIPWKYERWKEIVKKKNPTGGK